MITAPLSRGLQQNALFNRFRGHICTSVKRSRQSNKYSKKITYGHCTYNQCLLNTLKLSLDNKDLKLYAQVKTNHQIKQLEIENI